MALSQLYLQYKIIPFQLRFFFFGFINTIKKSPNRFSQKQSVALPLMYSFWC